MSFRNLLAIMVIVMLVPTSALAWKVTVIDGKTYERRTYVPPASETFHVPAHLLGGWFCFVGPQSRPKEAPRLYVRGLQCSTIKGGYAMLIRVVHDPSYPADSNQSIHLYSPNAYWVVGLGWD